MTSTRVRSTDVVWYSGQKQRVAKVQVLCDADGVVHSVSSVYPGNVHDKTVWNGEFQAVPFGCSVLADKAYAIAFRVIAYISNLDLEIKNQVQNCETGLDRDPHLAAGLGPDAGKGFPHPSQCQTAPRR